MTASTKTTILAMLVRANTGGVGSPRSMKQSWSDDSSSSSPTCYSENPVDVELEEPRFQQPCAFVSCRRLVERLDHVLGVAVVDHPLRDLLKLVLPEGAEARGRGDAGGVAGAVGRIGGRRPGGGGINDGINDPKPSGDGGDAPDRAAVGARPGIGGRVQVQVVGDDELGTF
uniref:Uncharacterized protein n=1 Tax=Leersia perrieri TaxID=77586 RepID=A0A0D9V653_9ORYZ